MKALIITMFVAAAPLRGQAAVVQRPLVPLTADSVSALRALHTTATANANEARTRHIRAGALTGLIIGGALGVFAGAKVPVGCEVGNCYKPHARVNAVVGLGSVGAVAGALVGTLIGAVVPAGSSSPASGSARPAP